MLFSVQEIHFRDIMSFFLNPVQSIIHKMCNLLIQSNPNPSGLDWINNPLDWSKPCRKCSGPTPALKVRVSGPGGPIALAGRLTPVQPRTGFGANGNSNLNFWALAHLADTYLSQSHFIFRLQSGPELINSEHGIELVLQMQVVKCDHCRGMQFARFPHISMMSTKLATMALYNVHDGMALYMITQLWMERRERVCSLAV